MVRVALTLTLTLIGLSEVPILPRFVCFGTLIIRGRLHKHLPCALLALERELEQAFESQVDRLHFGSATPAADRSLPRVTTRASKQSHDMRPALAACQVGHQRGAVGVVAGMEFRRAHE